MGTIRGGLGDRVGVSTRAMAENIGIGADERLTEREEVVVLLLAGVRGLLCELEVGVLYWEFGVCDLCLVGVEVELLCISLKKSFAARKISNETKQPPMRAIHATMLTQPPLHAPLSLHT